MLLNILVHCTPRSSPCQGKHREFVLCNFQLSTREKKLEQPKHQTTLEPTLPLTHQRPIEIPQRRSATNRPITALPAHSQHHPLCTALATMSALTLASPISSAISSRSLKKLLDLKRFASTFVIKNPNSYSSNYNSFNLNSIVRNQARLPQGINYTHTRFHSYHSHSRMCQSAGGVATK